MHLMIENNLQRVTSIKKSTSQTSLRFTKIYKLAKSKKLNNKINKDK